MRIISIFLLGLFIINQSCIPVKKDQIAAEIDTQSVEIRLQDSTIRNVLQAQNDQDLQALISYFGATDPSVRYAATAALGSVRDSSIIVRIYSGCVQPGSDRVAQKSIGPDRCIPTV